MIDNVACVRANLAPFLTFLALLFLRDCVAKLGGGSAHWALSSPQYWVFPLQTLVCGIPVWVYRRDYELRPASGIGPAGLAAFAIWSAPQFFFHAAPRLDGFDPAFFGSDGWPYWTNLAFRLARMIVIVPLIEEIFWRGFLLRYLVKDDFRSVPFGTFTWRSFLITTFAFCLEHHSADWPAAAITGALYNLTAYRTRSLAACIAAHAVTNLALALYILQTKQWGFW
jgi:CAAX prenyl protease-like protein